MQQSNFYPLPFAGMGDGVKLQTEALSGESFVLAEMPAGEFSADPYLFSKVGVAAWDHPLCIVLRYALVKTFSFVNALWLVHLISAIFGAATQMCALVANSNHSVQANSGNCVYLP